MKIINKLTDIDPRIDKEFFNYCWSYYGKGGCYANDMFNGGCTKQELNNAIMVRVFFPTKHIERFHYEGDTTDREIVRDIMLLTRNPKEITEYFNPKEFYPLLMKEHKEKYK